MKILVTGVCGQLGHDVMNELARRGHEAAGSDIHPVYSGADDSSSVCTMPYVQLDITDRDAVDRVISAIKPDCVIHCAAWTAVDAAEEEENIPKVRAVNTYGTANIAQAAAACGASIIYLSTDYVFDGKGNRPWQPDDDTFAPLNVYGQTKLEGEMAVKAATDRFFIVRTAWVFGLSGNNFIKTMVRLSEDHDMVRVVSDQIGTPTYTYDLARLLADMAESDRYGYYHATNSECEPGGFISWYDLAVEIYRQTGAAAEVCPVTTADYGLSKAARPANSRLDKSKLLTAHFEPLPDWKDALSRYLKEAGLNGR